MKSDPMTKEEDRFILNNELSYAPIRTRVDKISCKKCGKHFYVDFKVVPTVCPFCESPTPVAEDSYRCLETGNFLNGEEVTRFSNCWIRSKKLRCVNCKYLVVADEYDR